MQTSNPVFRNDPFAAARGAGGVMTISGAIWKTAFLLMLAVVTGAATWVLSTRVPSVLPVALGAGLVAFVLAIAISFKPTWAGVLAPVYALVEGILLGAFRPTTIPSIRALPFASAPA